MDAVGEFCEARGRPAPSAGCRAAGSAGRFAWVACIDPHNVMDAAIGLGLVSAGETWDGRETQPTGRVWTFENQMVETGT